MNARYDIEFRFILALLTVVGAKYNPIMNFYFMSYLTNYTKECFRVECKARKRLGKLI